MKLKIQNSQFKTHILVSLIICLLSLQLTAQELIFKDFKHLEGNTTARINRKRDVNGQNCAVIIIKHNFKNFKVETGKEYEALDDKIGETLVWVSPDEYRIIILKEGYIPFSFNLKDKLKELETYELIITDEFGTIKVSSPGAQIWLDNKPVANDSYTFTLKEGKYVLKASKEKYYDKENFVILNAGDSLVYNFDLKPKMGSLIVNSNPSITNGADIYINNSSTNHKSPATIPLIIGDYSLKLERSGFIPFNQRVEINENAITKIDAQMEVDPTLIILKQKKKKNFWLISTITTTAIGGFSYWQSNKLYSDYQSATTDASEIHKRIETYDIITPVAFGVAGLSLIEYIVHASKEGQAKRKLKLHTSYSNFGGTFSLNFTF